MTLLFACGGTGGHIFPAISTAQEIRARISDARIFYVCGKRDIEQTIFRNLPPERIFMITAAPFRGGLSLLNPHFLLKSASGFVQAARILKRIRPDVVVGFGGYFSFPVVALAKAMGIRTLVHEQNVMPGLANRVLARLVDGAALSYEETARFLPSRCRKRFTGNPIRAFIEKECRPEALDFFGFSEDKTTALVLGGSQGAESINHLFLSALEAMDSSVRQRLQVLHLCGRMRSEEALRRYEWLGVKAGVRSFFDRMDLAYGAADFAVGRAGATFLAEIAMKKIPAILIPYPYGDGHQQLNAESHARRHGAVVLEQKEITPRQLAKHLVGFVEGAGSSRLLRSRAVKDAAKKKGEARILLADFILEGRASHA